MIAKTKSSFIILLLIKNSTLSYTEDMYDFHHGMLDAMLVELDRLITKYIGDDWNSKDTVIRVVELLTEHRQLVQVERNQGGGANRTEADFLGPKERAHRRKTKLQGKGESDGKQEQKDYSKYFKAIELKVLEKKRRDMRDLAQKVAMERNIMNIGTQGDFSLNSE